MKKLMLSGIASVALMLVSGCETPGTHDSITTQEKTSLPDINTNGASGDAPATTNLNVNTTPDVAAPK